MRWLNFIKSFIFKTVYLIPLSIFFIKAIDRTYVIEIGDVFVSNFIEWFGVLYGILLPLILVRVWEQLDDIDREFDREADTVKLLYEDIFYLPNESASYAQEIAALLYKYVVHVKDNYRYEVKLSNNERDPNNLIRRSVQNIQDFLYRITKQKREVIETDKIRYDGEKILEDIRLQYRELVYFYANKTKSPDMFISEIFHRLNEIIDIRGDRIAFSSQRLFESLRLVALITSITFVLPFYFVGFTPTTPLLDNILIGGVTVLVIFIYLIIEDFDEPFGGTWRITNDSWQRVLDYMDNPKRKAELENFGNKNQLRRI